MNNIAIDPLKLFFFLLTILFILNHSRIIDILK